MEENETTSNNEIYDEEEFLTNEDIIKGILKNGWTEEIKYYNEINEEFKNITSTWDKYVCCFFNNKNELISDREIYARSPKIALDAFNSEYKKMFPEVINMTIKCYPHPIEILFN